MNRFGNGCPLWTDAERDELAEVWNNREDLTVKQIAIKFHRSVNAIRNQASIMRRAGRHMIGRRLDGVEPDNEPIVPFRMPPGMRYEDDPRAISTRPPVFVPFPSKPGYSGTASCIGGARVVTAKGRGGAS